MSDAPSAPPPVPGSAPAKKGLSPLAWIAIVVGGIMVVGFVGLMALGVFLFRQGREVVREMTGAESFSEFAEDLKDNPARASAETMIRMNPELDLIRTDDAAGTVTFRNNKTGEEATLNFADIAAGRFSMTTSEGEYSIDAADGVAGGEGGVTFRGPEGETRFGATAGLGDVPEWVPVYPGGSETQSAYQTTSGDGLSGAVSSKTADGVQRVVDYYKTVLEDAGYTIGAQSMTQSGDGAVGSISGELPEEERSINVTVIQQGGETQIIVNYTGK
jgi:hypothetical protein